MPYPSLHAPRMTLERVPSDPSEASSHPAPIAQSFPKFSSRPRVFSSALPHPTHADASSTDGALSEGPPPSPLLRPTPSLPPLPLRSSRAVIALPPAEATASVPWQEDMRFGIILLLLLLTLNLGMAYGLDRLPALPPVASSRPTSPALRPFFAHAPSRPITVYHDLGDTPMPPPTKVIPTAPSPPSSPVVHLLGGKPDLSSPEDSP